MKAGTDIHVSKYKAMPVADRLKLRDDKMKENDELMKKRADIAKKFKEMRDKKAAEAHAELSKKRSRFFSRDKPKKPELVAPVVHPPGSKPKTNLPKKVLSNVPVVKRVFKPTPEEELYGDAAASFVAGIKMGLFNTDKPLEGRRKEALLDWLELLSVSLPPELGVHEVVDALRSHVDFISQGQDKLNKILEEHPLSNNFWSESCSKGRKGQGFSCGFWKLLHIMSVGLSEQRGGIELCFGVDPDDEPRVFSTLEASEVVREYMAQFFGCETCRNNFMSKFDDCSFNRCSRLEGGDPDELTIEDWREFPLWIWEFHNDVSVRVASVKNKMQKKTKSNHMVQQWPKMEDCFLCHQEDGDWDMEEVYEFLEKTYWSGTDVDTPAKALAQYERSLITTRGSRSSLQFYSGVGLLLLLAYTVKRRKVIVTGMRKHFDTTPGGGGKKA
uniref:Sulfhydryl oxidase n=1 Tax=Odontella aurita TaxID=265563 RepID=A0A7S4NFG6_9STRA